MQTCTYCLDPIDGNVITSRFACGCQLTLHETCHLELVEGGRLDFCWYCQRGMLNGQPREEQERPAEPLPTQTPQDSEEPSQSSDTLKLEILELSYALLLVMYCFTMITTIYRIGASPDFWSIFAYGILTLSIILLLSHMIVYIIKHSSNSNYNACIGITWMALIEGIILIALGHYDTIQLVVVVSFASQFYIVGSRTP